MVRIRTWTGLIIGIVMATPLQAVEININSADATLMAAEIGGLGIRRAEAIVRYRNEHGSFTSVDQLSNVPGVSQRIIDINRENLTLGTPAGDTTAAQP